MNATPASRFSYVRGYDFNAMDSYQLLFSAGCSISLGVAGPGEIVSIMGEFKSGKSLILNILSGNIKLDGDDLLTGRILVNGFKRGQRWRRLCAHVSQSHEEFHGLLRVEEQLQFRAELALPDRWNRNKRERVVNWALQCMDLESLKLTSVDRLSLCEKRRLAISLALVGLPRVLLLDEPLDGLDPTRALELIKSLRRITQQRQMTTIITAKQLRESALPLIDRILLLAKGSTVYYGKFNDAITYFQTRLGLSIPEKGDNPLTCMLDAVSCMDCRRDPNHTERIHNEWEAYAFENQLYRTNYPSILLDGKLQ
jgi:ABC-type multidrug transport system ATPase subunit